MRHHDQPVLHRWPNSAGLDVRNGVGPRLVGQLRPVERGMLGGRCGRSSVRTGQGLDVKSRLAQNRDYPGVPQLLPSVADPELTVLSAPTWLGC
jgi:hypothetical protein